MTPYSIRATALAPGIFPSEMTQFEGAATGEKGREICPPLGRSGTPEDFVGTILYLSSRAGAYVNGVSLVVDGGRILSRSAA